GRRGPRVLDRTGLLPGDVARGGAGCGEAEDEQHLAGTALLLLRGRLEDGRADVALALLELLARRVDSGPQHGAGGLHGLAGAREVVVLHVVAELVGAGAEVGRDLVGLLPQALLGLGRVLVVPLGGPGGGLAGPLGGRRGGGGGGPLPPLHRLPR